MIRGRVPTPDVGTQVESPRAASAAAVVGGPPPSTTGSAARRRPSKGSSTTPMPRPLWRRPSVLVATGVALLATLWMVAPAGAQDTDPVEAVTLLGTQVNLLWVVIGALLVVFMQAGFALVETGFCRAKHAAHVVSTNFAIFGLGFVGFFFIGFPLAFGGFSYAPFGLEAPVGHALVGSGNWVFLWQGGWALSDLGTAAAAAP